ncbi:MAG: hypothetical protein SGPRY_004736 [Prymnesium sp.]
MSAASLKQRIVGIDCQGQTMSSWLGGSATPHKWLKKGMHFSNRFIVSHTRRAQDRACCLERGSLYAARAVARTIADLVYDVTHTAPGYRVRSRAFDLSSAEGVAVALVHSPYALAKLADRRFLGARAARESDDGFVELGLIHTGSSAELVNMIEKGARQWDATRAGSVLEAALGSHPEAHMLAKQKSKSRTVQAVIDALTSNPAYDGDIAHRLALQHLSGDGNIMSPSASKQMEEHLMAFTEDLRLPLWHRTDTGRSTTPLSSRSRSPSPGEQGGGGREGIRQMEMGLSGLLGVGSATPARSTAYPSGGVCNFIPPRGDRDQCRWWKAPREALICNTQSISRGVSLIRDRMPGAINASPEQLREMAMTAKAAGADPRTQKKDMLACSQFQEYASKRDLDPNLRSVWTAKFPERESLKLAGFPLYVAQNIRPRSKDSPAAKPTNVYQRYLALRRVFKRREVDMPPTAAVRDTFKGLLKRFISAHGMQALRQRRTELVTLAIVRQLLRNVKKGDKKVRGLQWSLVNWTCFITTAWEVINLSIGMRKGELMRLPGESGTSDWYTRDSVSFFIERRTYLDPPEDALACMRVGDYATLAPNGAKCDQYGTCYGADPIVLPFKNDELNAAKWMRDIELRMPCHSADRARTALFGQADVWLASSPRMVGASDALIQTLGRWISPESVRIYARLTKQDYASWLEKMLTVEHLDAARVTTLPIIMEAADALQVWGDTKDRLHDAVFDERATSTPDTLFHASPCRGRASSTPPPWSPAHAESVTAAPRKLRRPPPQAPPPRSRAQTAPVMAGPRKRRRARQTPPQPPPRTVVVAAPAGASSAFTLGMPTIEGLS